MRFHIVTLFPENFSYFKHSVIGRAEKRKKISVQFHNPRDFAEDAHRTTDDKPYGGGAGMVMKAEPILRAVGRIFRGKKPDAKTKIALLSAKGKPFTQKTASDWAKKYARIILISGRYEGIDERVARALHAEEISIGPYVTTDGDVASMVVVSSVSRLIPGVIACESLAEESHWDFLLKNEKKAPDVRALEYPHYTRPEVLIWKGKTYRVPAVLRSGNHTKIKAWRHARAGKRPS
ncbi:MAG: tRNA (guanosine(37)-N1)-methyltransferase TrmD [Parcubacteria group bacterium]|nr:tRNA (guanosine(37)-N1)-methyltransferase TrmD [Parcubacteria group bacterium]